MKAESVYRALLWCYPAAFRHEYGGEMQLLFAEQLDDARRRGARKDEAAVWLRAARDAITVAPKEHGHVILQDVRYALRTMAGGPAFTAVAILSLALGIGANTAMFSLWNGVLRSALPLIQEPERLVMLSDPNSSGVNNGSEDGERSLLTYAEFEQLRESADVFSGLMASQSSLDEWQIRVEGGEPENVSGRMVSSGYFDILGVAPQIGRAGDRGGRQVVISHDYWRRRFGGRMDVLGMPVTIRKAVLTIGGVAPAGFAGETSGQHPDVWAPLDLQREILPGRDWLHGTGTGKLMWLHVFGRLRNGVSVEQAQAKANAIFKAGLEAYYGSVRSGAAKREFLDQRLKIRPAAMGASRARQRFADPMQALLAAMAVVLVIACTNLANLLLARGAARQREIALRLSLGASRARLVRQLVTESLVLAAMGGAAGLAAAYAVHRTLVTLIGEIDSSFKMAFRLEPRVLAFTLAATLASAALFGLLPAWLATRTSAGESLKLQSRSATGSGGQLRWGRLLVALQLALSLPLLVGAGLLLRTLHNLQNADLGYTKERLLVAGRVDAQMAGYKEAQRAPLMASIREQIRLVPGVKTVSYSENGLLTGRDSGDEVEVEGYTRTGKRDRGARWDQVGPGYFAAVGAPILRGRDIGEQDTAASPKVCVINEAFAKLFFEGRDPLGKRITTVSGDSRQSHQVVGVARDFRTHGLRGEIPPRHFVPVTQPLGEFDGLMFVVRASGEPAAVLKGVQQAIRRVDGALPLGRAELIDDRVASRLAQDRIMARLALAFGVLAMTLTAIGLYGVLSYGVARRRSEIGIRIALGALPGRVIAMILRETGWIVVGGLALGVALAYGAARLIESQLYGLRPNDPASLGIAVGALIAVALAAAYFPARRASRMDPMEALRQE
ncbi:MAG: ABC transporter permease [Bryobacterales bacterium]|nr:ABC transporter permease [Bryobacterales bacterium]